MRALYYSGDRTEIRGEHPEPELAEAYAVVKMRLAGICSTDLQIIRGYMDFVGVLGHEFVGEVVAGPDALLGQRVVGEINFSCGLCGTCRSGMKRHCPDRKVLGILGADGVFAEYVRLPVANLHRVPATVSDEEAVFVEPLAAAYRALEQTSVDSTTEVVVLGDGKLGLLCAFVFHQAGARVTLVGRHQRKMNVARKLGVGTAGSARGLHGNRDIVIEATGTTDGLEQGLALVRPRGALVLKSTMAAQHALQLAPLVVNEVMVLGSRCGPFGPALASLEKEAIPVLSLVDSVFSLRDGLSALEKAREKGTMKVLVQP